MARIVREARDTFNRNYDHSIRDLKRALPDDAVDEKTGQPFWSGPKRSPQPLTFDPEDPTSMEFVWTCANLMFANFNMEVMSREQVKAIVKELPAAEYVASVVKVETPEEEKEREAAGLPRPQPEASQDDEAVIA